MKKIIIPISLLFVAGLKAQTTSENYIQSRVYLEPVTSTSTTAKQMQTVQYFDGLGRAKQLVNVKASPLGRDVVTHIEYDQFGRQVKDYLPVPQSSTQNGAIFPTPLSNATQSDIYGNEKIYGEKVLENSPLDRIQQQIQVGTDWSTKPVKFEYDANTTADGVKKYTITTVWGNGTTVSTLGTTTTTYGANQLYKNTVIDEDGNKTIEFKNGKGQVILVRKVLSSTENADTYYVYNEYDQLAFVIPPVASKVADVNIILGNYCYLYRYDGRGRQVLKKLPGKGWEFMVYDKQDRLVMSQDGVMGANKQWLFTKYDQFGRVAYTGIYTSSQAYSAAGRAAEQALVDARGSNNVARTSAVGFTSNGMGVYYDNGSTSYPSTITTLLSVNYYDTYPAGSPGITNVFSHPLLTATPTSITTNGVTSVRSTKGLPLATYVKNIEDDGWTKNYTWYDTLGRVFGSRSNNHLGGYTVVNHQLDFSGVPLQTYTYHRRLMTDTEILTKEVFTYDHQNRLLTHTHRVGSNPIEILAQNTYNELSQLKAKKVGGTVAASPLQTIDYKYNIRGWMTQINDPSNLGTDLFGYKINYNQIEGLAKPYVLDYPNLQVSPKYNGNISEVSWKTLTEENEPLKRYGYVYDGLNRLTAGFYQKAGSESAGEYFEKMDYDLNGNITYLKRSAGVISGSTTANVIDNLKYAYTGNRLTKVTEQQIGNSNGYPYLAVPNTITYDLNSNMTSHLDKGISSIAYNYLNLPKQITQNSVVTNYIYRADGVKVKKLFGDIETDYLDGFQYKSTKPSESSGSGGLITAPDPNEVAVMKLRIIPTSEGYYDALNNEYIYHYTDHLGNVRLSYSDTNKDGVIQPRQYKASECFGNFNPPFELPICTDYWKPGEIVEVNNYYPFGLLHNYTATTQNVYQYKYNGKELQETGMYDYGWRQYMPDLGRWFTIDPLAELGITITPYRYGFNNPILYTDPFGLFEKKGNALATCPTCPNTKEFQPYINDPNKVYVYNPETNTAEREIQIQEVTVTGKKETDNQQQNIYSPLGQGNTLLSFNGTYMANLSYRRYIGTARPNSPFTYRGARYYGNGQTFLKSESLINTGSLIKVGKGVGAGTVVIGAVLDWGYGVPQYKKDPNSPNAVSPGKASLNTGMAAYGLTGVGTMPSLVYFGLDAFYPGGFNGYVNDVGSAQTELDKGVNSAGPYRVNLTGAHEPK